MTAWASFRLIHLWRSPSGNHAANHARVKTFADFCFKRFCASEFRGPNARSMSSEESGLSPEGILKPGVVIRPQTSTQTAVNVVKSLYGFTVTKVQELDSYDDRNYYVEVDPRHFNPHVRNIWPHGYVLKILNSMESQKQHVEAEHQMKRLLIEQGFNCRCPIRNLQGDDKSLEKFPAATGNVNNNEVDDEACVAHVVRLVTYLPGKLILHVPYTPSLLYQVGTYLAQVETALEDYHHPALTDHTTIWRMDGVLQLKQFLFAVKDTHHQNLVLEIIAAFEQEVVPKYPQFTRGVIHGDFNDQNIIVQHNPDPQGCGDEYRIHGVIDFADASESYYVFEVAIIIMYMMVESKVVDPLLVGGHVLAGYTSVKGLSEAEYDALKVCVAARYTQSLVMGAYTYSLDPSNEYLLSTASRGWQQLQLLWNTPKDKLYAGWKDIMAKYL